MVPNDGHNSGARTAGIVQIGDAIAKTRPEVQQSQRRLAGHTRIAIRRAGANALEQGKHGADFRHISKRIDERQFSCAGVCEADARAPSVQRL